MCGRFPWARGASGGCRRWCGVPRLPSTGSGARRARCCGLPEPGRARKNRRGRFTLPTAALSGRPSPAVMPRVRLVYSNEPWGPLVAVSASGRPRSSGNSLLVLVDSRGRGRSAGSGYPVDLDEWRVPSLRALALAPSSACDPTRIGSRRGAARLRARRRVTDVETGERPTSSEAVRRFLSWFSSAAILRPRWLPFFPHPERRVSRPSFRLRGRPARTVRCRLSASAARPDKVRRKRHRGATVPGASSDPVSTRVRAASSSGYSQSPRRFTRPRSPARRVGGGRAPAIGEPERRKCAVSQSQVLAIFPSLAW